MEEISVPEVAGPGGGHYGWSTGNRVTRNAQEVCACKRIELPGQLDTNPELFLRKASSLSHQATQLLRSATSQQDRFVFQESFDIIGVQRISPRFLRKDDAPCGFVREASMPQADPRYGFDCGFGLQKITLRTPRPIVASQAPIDALHCCFGYYAFNYLTLCPHGSRLLRRRRRRGPPTTLKAFSGSHSKARSQRLPLYSARKSAFSELR